MIDCLKQKGMIWVVELVVPRALESSLDQRKKKDKVAPSTTINGILFYPSHFLHQIVAMLGAAVKRGER